MSRFCGTSAKQEVLWQRASSVARTRHWLAPGKRPWAAWTSKASSSQDAADDAEAEQRCQPKRTLPTLPHVLRTLAQTPRGCVKFYLDPKKLCKWVKKHAKGAHPLLQRACVLSRLGEEQNAEKSWNQLYKSPHNWILRFKASVEARCPGT